jgi:hypothetical protein
MDSGERTKIKVLRARTEASIKQCRAALVETDWNVDDAVALLLTEEDIARERNGLFARHVVQRSSACGFMPEDEQRLSDIIIAGARRQTLALKGSGSKS